MKRMLAIGKCTGGKMTVRTNEGEVYCYEVRQSVLERQNETRVVAEMVDCTQRYILPVKPQSS